MAKEENSRLGELEKMNQELREQLAKMAKEVESLNQDSVKSGTMPYQKSGTMPYHHQLPTSAGDCFIKSHEMLKQKAPEFVEGLEAPQKFELLEKRLRAVEGVDVYESIDTAEINLVPRLVVPSKFKIPNFEKFDGSDCPRAHVRMYCRKMAMYAKNEELLIHYFQESLTGSALRWYAQLSKSQVQSWGDLARLFIAHYQYLTSLLPNTVSLQNMKRRNDESFKEYVRRWRNMASQVVPPLPEKEMTMLFVDTLESPYFEMLIGNVLNGFADVVRAGENIECAIQKDRIRVPNRNKIKGGESDHAANWGHQRRNRDSQNFEIRQSPRGQRRKRKERMAIEPIPISYTDLLPQLFADQLLMPIILEPL